MAGWLAGSRDGALDGYTVDLQVSLSLSLSLSLCPSAADDEKPRAHPLWHFILQARWNTLLTWACLSKGRQRNSTAILRRTGYGTHPVRSGCGTRTFVSCSWYSISSLEILSSRISQKLLFKLPLQAPSPRPSIKLPFTSWIPIKWHPVTNLPEISVEYKYIFPTQFDSHITTDMKKIDWWSIYLCPMQRRSSQQQAAVNHPPKVLRRGSSEWWRQCYVWRIQFI